MWHTREAHKEHTCMFFVNVLTNVASIHINESRFCALTERRGCVCKHTLAVFYGATSVSATVFTKSVMSGYGFRFLPFMMTLERMFMASSLLLSEKRSLQGVLQSCQQLWPLTLVSVVNLCRDIQPRRPQPSHVQRAKAADVSCHSRHGGRSAQSVFLTPSANISLLHRCWRPHCCRT